VRVATGRRGTELAMSGMFYLQHDKSTDTYMLRPKSGRGENYALRREDGKTIKGMLKRCPSNGTNIKRYTVTGGVRGLPIGPYTGPKYDVV